MVTPVYCRLKLGFWKLEAKLPASELVTGVITGATELQAAVNSHAPGPRVIPPQPRLSSLMAQNHDINKTQGRAKSTSRLAAGPKSRGRVATTRLSSTSHRRLMK